MTDHDEYFEYLKRRKPRAIVYRRHWLYPRLANRLRGHTLDIGCGIGDMLDFRPDTVGVDINARAVKFCRQRGLAAETMEIDRLPFETGSFDSVLMDNVLEHILEPAAILSEIRRVLRPNARFLVGVPGRRGWGQRPGSQDQVRRRQPGRVRRTQRLQALRNLPHASMALRLSGPEGAAVLHLRDVRPGGLNDTHRSRRAQNAHIVATELAKLLRVIAFDLSCIDHCPFGR